MLKHLTLAAFAAALLPACVLTTDNTTSDPTSDSDSASTGTGSGTTTESGTTTDSGTATDSASTTDTPTTDNSTTDTPTTVGTTTAGTTTTDGTTTDDNTTGQSGFGKCGWADAGFYACEEDGGAPGVSDPDAVSPIACGEGIVAGEKCDGMLPVSEAGCCTPEGTLYFCDTQTDPNAPSIFEDPCGV